MAAAGADAPMVKASDGTMRPALAGELASKAKIDHWVVVDSPQRGDIAAYKLSGGGTSYSGHTAVVTGVSPNGTVSAMAAHGYGVGPENKMTSTPTHPVTYRRYME